MTPVTEPQPYSRAYHEQRIDRHLNDLADAIQRWEGRDREDWIATNIAAGRLQLVMRSLSADAAALAALGARDRLDRALPST